MNEELLKIATEVIKKGNLKTTAESMVKKMKLVYSKINPS